MDEEIKIYQSRSRRFFHMIHFLILSIACLSISFHFFLQFGEAWYNNLLLILFLLVIPSYIMRFSHHLIKFFSRQPLYILTKEGIWNQSRIGMRGLIRWNEVEHIFIRKALLNISGDQVALYNRSGLVAVLSLQATSISGTDLIEYMDQKKRG